MMFVHSYFNEGKDKFLWVPVLIGIGIIFASKFTLMLFLSFLIVSSFVKNDHNITIVIILILVGVIAISVRSYFLNTKFIERTIYVHKAIGRVHEINHKVSYSQLVISDIKHFKLKKSSKIRIKAHKFPENIQSGDIILFSAKLSPPSKPVSPYAYDFSHFAYFAGISAVGFATTPIKLYSKQNSKIFSQIDIFRNYITKSFITIIGERNGNIAAALIVGKRQGIDRHIMENIRKAGLAHLFAISGLHLTIVTFFFFILFRKIFALSVFIATKYNIKKIAAIVGIIASFFYLIISGMAISAQRAFIMVLIVLIGILIDRNSSTMRSIAVAATIILLLEPESVFRPSFQMSFAAVIGLCSFYESYRRLYIHNLFYRFCGYFSSIALSSMVASLATTPYTIYHFNYFSLGGIFSNLIAIPFTTFIILPFGIISAILIPFNLAGLSSFIMSIGINSLIYLSDKIGNMPYSSLLIHTFNNSSILLITLGILWLCLWRYNWRFLGIPVILLGTVIGLNYKTPDILMNEKMVAVKGGDGKLYFLSKYRKNFVNKTWISQNGQHKSYLYTKHNNNDKVKITCHDGYCKYYNKGKSILFLSSLSDQIEISDFDYVIHLKNFSVEEEASNIIPFSEVKKGYFVWLDKL